MKRIMRLIAFISICVIFLAFGLLAQPVLFFFSQRTKKRFSARGSQMWAQSLMRMINMKIVLHGWQPEHRHKNFLLVSNHQSYLDIAIIASIFPTLFVAKTEVGNWPLLGWLAGLSDTIFLDREDAHSGVICTYRASRLLREGISVQVFPESTTSNGTTVLPFKALFFASAIRANREVLPVTINFEVVNGQAVNDELRDLMCWYGDADFVRHFWELLKIDSAEVSLMIHDPIKCSRPLRSRALAQLVQEKVTGSFNGRPASAVEAARAEVPVEFAAANEQVRTEAQSSNENESATDFLVGALLYSLLVSNQSESINEMIPRIES